MFSETRCKVLPHVLVAAEAMGEHESFRAGTDDFYIIPGYDLLFGQNINLYPVDVAAFAFLA